MGTGDILILFTIIAGLIIWLLYFLNKKASQKMGAQQEIIEKSKQTVTIFVIDKKRAKMTEVNLPKVVLQNVPKAYKFLKMYFVQAKLGSQIATFMCDKKVFNAITTKKNIKVEIAGIYIVNVVGMKSEKELKALKKAKKLKKDK